MPPTNIIIKSNNEGVIVYLFITPRFQANQDSLA